MEARMRRRYPSQDIISRIENEDESIANELTLRGLLKYYQYNPKFMVIFYIRGVKGNLPYSYIIW